MRYATVLKLPQYFRNLQRLSEIVSVFVRHGFGDLVERLQVNPYLERGLKIVWPSFTPEGVTRIELGTRFRQACEELGPTFIKLAQLIATRPDIFPASVTQQCSLLHDNVPPFLWTSAEEVLRHELGPDFRSLFTHIDQTPLAAASIAQVHRARLLDGSEVIVKIQRPGIEKVIETDIDILRGLAALLEEHVAESRSLRPVELVEEFARSLERECDFDREARHAQLFKSLFKDDTSILVPTVYNNICTDRVIIEDWIDGVRFDDTRIISASTEQRSLLVSHLTRSFLRSIFEYRFFHADPHPGNIRFTKEWQVAFLDFGAMGRLEEGRVESIVQFLLGIVERDLDKLIAVLIETETLCHDVDERHLRSHLLDIIENYAGEPLGNLDLGAMLAEIYAVVRRFELRLPPDLLLVAKALTSLASIGLALDPTFQPVPEVAAYLRHLYLQNLKKPQRYKKMLRDAGASYRHLFERFPLDARLLLSKLVRGNLTFVVTNPDRERHEVAVHRMVNRAITTFVGLTFVVLGLLFASGAVAAQTGGAGYVLAVVGTVLLLAVWRAIGRSGGL